MNCARLPSHNHTSSVPWILVLRDYPLDEIVGHLGERELSMPIRYTSAFKDVDDRGRSNTRRFWSLP